MTVPAQPRVTMSRAEVESVLPKVPPELHRLLLWLATGQDPQPR